MYQQIYIAVSRCWPSSIGIRGYNGGFLVRMTGELGSRYADACCCLA